MGVGGEREHATEAKRQHAPERPRPAPNPFLALHDMVGNRAAIGLIQRQAIGSGGPVATPEQEAPPAQVPQVGTPPAQELAAKEQLPTVSPCSPHKRQDQSIECCTEPMLSLLRTFRDDAVEVMTKTQAALDEMAKDVRGMSSARRDALWTNFRLIPPSTTFDDSRGSLMVQMTYMSIILDIKANYGRMIAAAKNPGLRFFCRQSGAAAEGCPGGLRATAGLSGEPRITFCGSYEGAAGGTFTFLDDSFKRTMIHELAHVSGLYANMRFAQPTDEKLGTPMPVESYYGEPGYPGADAEQALRNPDSYAAFAYTIVGRGAKGAGSADT